MNDQTIKADAGKPKPCPFCGEIVNSPQIDLMQTNGYQLEARIAYRCKNCGTAFIYYAPIHANDEYNLAFEYDGVCVVITDQRRVSFMYSAMEGIIGGIVERALKGDKYGRPND